MTARQRSPRSRSAKSPLSMQLIVEAGLEVLRAEGLEAVTMRRVASALDTGPASLYVYVAGRDDLLAAMLDSVFGTVPRPELPVPQWRSTLLELLTTTKRALDAHPGIATAALGAVPAGPSVLAITRLVVDLLRSAGVCERSALWGCDVLALHVVSSSWSAGIRRAREQGPSPQLAALAPLFASTDDDERFSFGLELILDALAP